MSFFREMDLYKVVILLSLLLTPAALFWAYQLQGEIEEGQAALRRATAAKGDLQQIAMLRKEVIGLVSRKAENEIAKPDNYATYFQNQVYGSIRGESQLQSNEMFFAKKIDKNTPPDAEDFVVDVSFKRDNKDIPFGRDVLMAFIYNVEAQSPLWKLRRLLITNASIRDLRGRAAPPPETEDRWIIQAMEFGARKKREDPRRR